MPDVVMPQLSESMREGTLLQWLVADGAEVAAGDELALVETDKATMSCEAEAGGVLRVIADEGDTVPVGEVIATIGEDAAAARPAPAVPAVPAIPADPAGPAVPAAASGAGGRRKVSPVARRLARERGVDLATVEGSGPGGRIVKADVPAAPAPAAAAPPAGAAGAGAARGEVRVEELTRTQGLIARRMSESRATVPDFSIRMEVDMENCVEMRGRLVAVADPVPSYNDMIVKACAIALREHPRVNAAYVGDRRELYSRVNVGIAIAAPDTLVVATIFDADRKGLGTIAREARELAARVRRHTVEPGELDGATFTVSNLGMHGVTEFEAVINAPQAGILAVGAVRPVPAARGGELVIRHVMAVTLACDHRILYGADAARFLGRVRGLLEEPSGLAL